MNLPNNLELKGNLQTHPFAELILEACEANLTGSFRLASESNKVIVYLTGGKIVFAVSNSRRFRLFELLLGEKKITQKQLTEISDFTNDFAFAANLRSENLFSEAEVNNFFSMQIAEILTSVFEWTSGDWIFSSQSRIKENIHFEINLSELLLEYARELSPWEISKRLANENETFGAKPNFAAATNLFPSEAFVFSRFEKSFLAIREIKFLSGLPEMETLRILYILWLGGLLFRQNWTAAFPARRIAELLSARLELKKEAVSAPPKLFETIVAPPVAAEETVVTAAPENTKTEEISLDDYFAQTEKAADLYEILNVARDSESKEIKRRYFALARQFHPDMFHKEKNSALLQRVQNAFALTAQAYETLKDAETRKVYDYKLSKNSTGVKQAGALTNSAAVSENSHAEQAKEAFEQGFSLLMENEYQEAATFLARAVHLAQDNAKYHAYYGKALSADETQRHKADSELQIAIRLDPQNIAYKILSAELYIQFGLFKRAEGELNRILSLSPNNSEAQKLLDNLSKRQK